MSKIEDAIVGIGGTIGMSEEYLREHMRDIRPHLENAVVFIGMDVVGFCTVLMDN
jgi:hypothetical protein